MTIPEEAPPINYIDGVPHVNTPVEFLRNALWYHDNYFVQKERADGLRMIVDNCNENYGVCIDDLEEAEIQNATLQRKLSIWRGTTFAVGITSLATITIMGLVQ